MPTDNDVKEPNDSFSTDTIFDSYRRMVELKIHVLQVAKALENVDIFIGLNSSLFYNNMGVVLERIDDIIEDIDKRIKEIYYPNYNTPYTSTNSTSSMVLRVDE